MTVVNSILSWIMKKRIHQIEFFMKYPNEVQEEWLFNLINGARNTEWGRKYDYKSIETREEFVNRVPLQNYDTLKPYIERMMQGEENILWFSEIKWFAKSSGTTSDKSKFIPVSNESLEECHYKGGKDLLSIYCNNQPESKIFTGKCLIVGGSNQISPVNEAISYGDLSAVLIKNLPMWAEFHTTPNSAIALMEHWEEKLETIANATINVNVTNISGVPTWTVLLAKRILEITGKNNLLEVWPNLELYFHGAVNFAPYREQFQKLIPSSEMYYLETYSTNGGLWRYVVGDTIQFTSLNPYRILITGRTKHFINAFGEELIIDNAEKALVKACSICNAAIKDYTAGPIYFSDKKSGGHEWIIEFEKAPLDLDTFTDCLDAALKEINSDYEAKRKGNIALLKPIVHLAPADTFYNWMKNRGKLGGQHKVPRLANNRIYIDEILNMINI